MYLKVQFSVRIVKILDGSLRDHLVHMLLRLYEVDVFSLLLINL